MTASPDTKKALDANALLDKAAAEPTLDQYMDRDPLTLTEADLTSIIQMERAERPRFLAAKAERQHKKAEKEASEDPSAV